MLYDEAMTLAQKTDHELMEATGRGCSSSFTELVMRHQKRAWTIARRFLGNHVDAEDIVQQAFAKILVAAERYKPTGSFEGYLRVVVSRLCMDFCAKGKGTPSESLGGLQADGSSMSSKVQRLANRSAVRHALDLLPPKQRLVIVLRYYDGAGYEEIGQALDMTHKAVEGVLARARGKLRKHLAASKKIG